MKTPNLLMNDWFASIDLVKAKRSPIRRWKSPTNSGAIITRMKDGRTRLGVKAEHTVDLGTEVTLSSVVTHSCGRSLCHKRFNHCQHVIVLTKLNRSVSVPCRGESC